MNGFKHGTVLYRATTSCQPLQIVAGQVFLLNCKLQVAIPKGGTWVNFMQFFLMLCFLFILSSIIISLYFFLIMHLSVAIPEGEGVTPMNNQSFAQQHLQQRHCWLLVLIHKNYLQLLVGCQVVKIKLYKKGRKVVRAYALPTDN